MSCKKKYAMYDIDFLCEKSTIEVNQDTERMVKMMKKFVSFSLALLLSLSLFTAGASAAKKPQEPVPTPTPEITLQPLDPEGPEEPGIMPQDDPPEPRPVVL